MENVRRRLLLFGVGDAYRDNRSWILNNADIVAFIDNDKMLHGTMMDGARIFAPEEAISLPYDKIALMSSKFAAEMKQQLITLGIDGKNVLSLEALRGKLCGHQTVYGKFEFDDRRTKILIITNNAGYHGGAVAVYSMAEILASKGYIVHVAAPEGDEGFIFEMRKKNIMTIIDTILPYVDEEDANFWQPYDVVIVNTFPMIQCAAEISKTKPVIWWLHESVATYESTIQNFSEYLHMNALERVDIYAVSRIARDNFNRYFPNRAEKLLFYGIGDVVQSKTAKWFSSYSDRKTIFAVIGMMDENKAQLLAIDSYLSLDKKEIEKSELWLIGKNGGNRYGIAVQKEAALCSNIKIIGALSRAEMASAYRKIDVVVCPSVEDSLPVVLTEGMMYGRVCVTSDKTGTADLIRDGWNGFIVRQGDKADLCRVLRYIIANRGNLNEVKKRARETYEEFFTMESFADRIDAALKIAIGNKG